MENNMITFSVKKTTLRKVIVLGLAVLVFLFAFCHWYNINVNMYGYKFSESFGPYSGLTFMGEKASLSEFSGWFIVAKVFLIIDLIVFVIYMATNFVNIEAFIPTLSGKMVNDLAHKAYFVIMAIALFCALIGDFATENSEYFHMEGGWYLTVIFTVLGCVNAFKPQLLKTALNKIK